MQRVYELTPLKVIEACTIRWLTNGETCWRIISRFEPLVDDWLEFTTKKDALMWKGSEMLFYNHNLFTNFSCNILLTNIYIDLLLLALVFSKNFSTFNKQYSKFIMCYNFNYRLVLDLYILFQSFRAVLITQKLGSNFKYQLHCIMACVIMITFNRFLNY